jgi:hypothetical protein
MACDKLYDVSGKPGVLVHSPLRCEKGNCDWNKTEYCLFKTTKNAIKTQ